MADIKYVITVDQTGAQTAIQKFDDAVNNLGSTSGKTEKASDGLFGKITGGVIAANLATKALSFLTGELGSVITEATEAEKINSVLNSTLRAHGESAKVMGDVYDQLANDMQAMTGVQDEEIKSLISLAYNLGVNKERIDDVTKGAVGLTTLYGGSLQSNLEAVARAYQGNWRQAEMMIPELRTMTDESDKLALMQKKMAEGFQASTDAMKGSSGALIQAKNDWSNFKEGVGTGALTLFGALMKVNDALSGTGKMARALREEHMAYEKVWAKRKESMLVYSDIIADETIKDKEWAKVEAEVNEMLKEQKPLVQGVTDAVQVHEQAVKAFMKVLDKMPPAQKEFNDEIEIAVPILEQYEGKLDDTTFSIGEWTVGNQMAMESLFDLCDTVTLLGSLFDGLLPGLGNITQGFSDMGGMIASGTTSMTGFLSAGLMIAKGLDEAFGNFFDNVVADIEGVIGALKQMNILMANSAVTDALELLNQGKLTPGGGPPLPYKGDRPNFSAASGFHSSQLSNDTLIRAHRGERVDITPASQNASSGGASTIHNYIYLDGKLMKEFIVSTVNGQGGIGNLRIPRKAIT